MVKPKAGTSKRAPSDDETSPNVAEDASAEAEPRPPIPIAQILEHLEALVAHLTHQVLEAKIELDKLKEENEAIKGPLVAVINEKKENIALLTAELEKCEREKAALDERNAQLEHQIEVLEAAEKDGAVGGKKTKSR